MKKLFVPVIIFICFAGTYVGISHFSNNDFLFQPVWDVRHYLDISEIGYQVHPCTPGVDGPPGAICGNPGWFPMWPLAVKAIRPIFGGSSKYTFIGLAFLFTLLAFILIFHFLERYLGFKAAAIGTLAMAFNPASFYWISGFPYAFFAFLIMVYLLLLYRRDAGFLRHAVLFIIAVMISLCYPTGILVGIIPFVRGLYASREKGFSLLTWRYWAGPAAYLIPFVLGPLLLSTYFYFKFDDFFLQLHFQEKYNRTWAIPFWIMAKSLFTDSPLTPENISIIWFALIFILFYPFKLKNELWVAGLAFYLFSLSTGTTMSIYRHYLIILPGYMIIGSSPRPLWVKIVFIVSGFLAALLIMFPRFMAYRLM